MPDAGDRFCLEPGCRRLVRRGRCPDHRRQVDAWQRWYNWNLWRHPVYGLRATVLREQPFCAGWPPGACRRALTDADAVVDHVVPHRGIRRLFFDRANLQGLCSTCHAAKTRSGL